MFDSPSDWKGKTMIRACWLLVALLVVSAASPGQPAEPIEKLIEKLSDEDFEVRTQAARAIAARGHEALPALRAARNHPDPEVRRRISEWIPQLERAEILAPRRVTLHVTNRPVKEVVELIAKQTGYKIELNQDDTNKTAITLDLDKATLWEALDRVCVAGGTVIQHGYGDQTVRLQFLDHHVPFVHRDGAFRLVGTGFHLGRSVNFSSIPNQPDASDQQSSESLSFSFSLTSEPRLPLLGAGSVKVTKAIDNLGNDLRPNDQQGLHGSRFSHYWGGHRMNTMSLNAALAGPARHARSVKLLEGSVPLTLLIREETIELTKDLQGAKGKKFTGGSVQVHVVELTDKGNNQHELKLEVTPVDNKDAGDNAWMNTLYSRIELADEKGNKLPLYGSSMSRNGNLAQIAFTYGNRGGAGKPARLIYHDWTTMQHEVSFQFRDLPLP
ncbi:MAG: HEAT repeat domain-containing protein [Gemmataceae bacterium]